MAIAYNYPQEPQILEIAAKAISFESVSAEPDPFHISQMNDGLAYLEQEASKLGLFFNRGESNNFPWTCINNVGSEQRNFRFAIMVHFDVVVAQKHDASGNPINMFAMNTDEMHIYGRGAADMKSFLGPVLLLFAWMKELGIDLPVALFVTCDEEVGGQNGTLAMLQDGYRADVIALPDGGLNWNPSIRAKGAERYQITVKSDGGDSARPWGNVNLIEHFYALLKSIRRQYPLPTADTMDRLSATLTEIHTNNAVGTMPPRLDATMDVRMFEKDREKFNTSMQRRLKRLAKIAGIREVICDRLSVASFEADATNPIFQQIMRVAEDVTGIVYPRDENGLLILTGFDTGASDARYFMNPRYGNPVIILMAPDVENSHGINERVSRRGLELYFKFLQQIVLLLKG